MADLMTPHQFDVHLRAVPAPDRIAAIETRDAAIRADQRRRDADVARGMKPIKDGVNPWVVEGYYQGMYGIAAEIERQDKEKADAIHIEATDKSKAPARHTIGECCYCGYTGKHETQCKNSADQIHCNHWWDGPEERPMPRRCDACEGTGHVAKILSSYEPTLGRFIPGYLQITHCNVCGGTGQIKDGDRTNADKG